MAKLNVPYLVLRDGRPRWVPGKHLRARGYKGRDLKRPNGEWMGEAEAVTAARAINAQVAEQAIALPPPVPEAPRTIAELFRRLKASPKFQDGAPDADQAVRVGAEKLKLAPRTRHDYLYHMTILEAWSGDVAVDQLDGDMIEEFYHDQAEGRGLTTANAIMRTLKLAMNYGMNRLRWINFNPVRGVKLITAEGRIEIFEADEIAAIMGAAAWCGLPSIGDAFVIGALGGQRKQDILALPRGELMAGHYVIQPRKTFGRTGKRAFVPITAPLLARVEAMRARNAELFPNVRHTLEVINSRTGQPYPSNAKVFGEDWRLVRAVAAGDAATIARVRAERLTNSGDLPFTPAPSVKSKLFMDTRDTAVTILFMAACNEGEIANITGHSLKTVRVILDRHYFKRNAALAKSAGIKLDAYLEASNIRWA